jgi:hypothetical protein
MAEDFTVKQAYELGFNEASEAAERGEPFSMGMVWDNQNFNKAYDEGVNAAQRAYVIQRYPDAYAMHLSETDLWQVWGGSGDQFLEPLGEGDVEYEAWEAAAAHVGLEELEAQCEEQDCSKRATQEGIHASSDCRVQVCDEHADAIAHDGHWVRGHEGKPLPKS